MRNAFKSGPTRLSMWIETHASCMMQKDPTDALAFPGSPDLDMDMFPGRPFGEQWKKSTGGPC